MSGEERLTYRELARRTADAAEILRRIGVGAGIQVAVMFPNGIDYLVWFFGALEAGGIVVPVSPALTAAEAEELLDSASIHYLVTTVDAGLPTDLGLSSVATGAGTAEGIALWHGIRAFPPLPTTPWAPDGILIRQFSSGSTGRAKHLLVSESKMAFNLTSICETYGLHGPEIFIGVTPFFHGFGRISFLAAFHLGGSVVVLPRFLPASVIDAVRRHRATVIILTPAMAEALGICLLEDGDDRAFRTLKICETGGARLRQEVYDVFKARFGVPIRVKFGSAETLGNTVDLDDDYEEGRAGRPYFGVEVGIFDDSGEPCPPRIHGLIGIRSPAACERYEDDAESTARTFRDGYVFLGDVGYLDESGRLYVLGRSDIINIGGYKVDPLEVERVIRDSLPVKEVIVLLGERVGQPVVRAVVEADPGQVTRAQIIGVCRERLTSYKVPALVEVRARLERDANGKVLRAALDV